MDRRRLFILFLCNLIPWTVGYGIVPLLPVYAGSLGASAGSAGAYLAFSYAALAAGALAAGWLSERGWSRRGVLAASGAVAVPLIWSLGRVADLWQLTAATALLWFMGGLAVATTNILVGLSAGSTERGSAFGLLTLANPLGLLLGGLVSGPIADRWGFAAMFTAFAAFAVLWPLLALGVKSESPTSLSRERRTTGEESSGLGTGFVFLLVAGLAVMIGFFAGSLGRSLAMQDLGFSATAISSTGAVSGAFILPFTWLSGRLSDRVGRKGFLVGSYLAGALGLGLLAVSVYLWQFWLATCLLYVQNLVSRAVGFAFVTDLVPRKALSRSLALYTSTWWLGGVVGFGLTGLVIQQVGTTTMFLLAALLPLTAVVLLSQVHAAQPEPNVRPLSEDG